MSRIAAVKDTAPYQEQKRRRARSEMDNRGYILAVDRNGAGFEILELHGKALQIGQGK